MLAHILTAALLLLGAAALYGTGRAAGYRAGYRDAADADAPVVFRPTPAKPDPGPASGTNHDKGE